MKQKWPPAPFPTKGTVLSIIAIAAVSACLASSGIQLIRGSGGIAALWLPNALVVAVMLRSSATSKGWLLAASLVGNIAINRIVGDGWATAAVFAMANAVEVGIVTCTIARLCGQNPRLDQLSTLGWLLVVCLIAPVASGAIAAGGVAAIGGSFSVRSFLSWAFADGLSLMTVIPVVMTVIDSLRARRKLKGQDLVEWGALLLGTIIVTGAIFGQSRVPLLFLACPIVIVAVFRKGVAGAVGAVSTLALVASVATILNSGPFMLVYGDLADRLTALQLFLATNFAMGLPVAAVLSARDQILSNLDTSEARFRRMAEAAPVGIFRADALGQLTYVNPMWCNKVGFTMEGMLGNGWMNALKDTVPFEQDPAWQGFHRPGDTRRRIACFRAADGSDLWIETVNSAEFDADGQICGYFGAAHDITEQRRATERMVESERRFKTLAGLAPAGIFRADTNGRCTYVNAAWLRISGLSEDDWQNGGWATALHPEDSQRVFQGWAAAVEARAEYRDEFRMLRPDGTEVWTDVSAQPEFDDHGSVIGFIGVQMDISERRRAEAKLAEREAQLTLLANNATDAIFRLSLDGHCLYASPSARSLLGIDAGLLVGAQMLTRFHPDDHDAVTGVFAALASAQIEKKIIAYRAELLHQPGVYRWMEAHCGLVRDEQGAPCEIIASIRDVSASKAMEDDLREARERALGASAAKAAFLANVSHEIRTPMNGVFGFTEMLAETELDPKQRHYVRMIADSGRAMMRLLNDILDMSKIDSGNMHICAEPVDLAKKIRKCSQLMIPVASAKRVELTFAVDPALPKFVVGDKLRLRQLLLNLIGNAVKFTDSGSVRVTAKSVDGQLQIEIADTGVGIAPDRLCAIFQRFSQADDSVASKYGGTGLGLSISAELAKLMGGSISVVSEVGVGTTFTVTLPLIEADWFERGQPATLPLTALPTWQGDSSLRVLIAEDHDINQALITAMATAAGLVPTIAVNGAEAVEMVQAAAAAGNPYDLVLMDIQMPVLDGLEASRQIRGLGYGPDRLPIIAVSANAYAADIAGCIAAGMQGHLPKPIRLRDLRGLVEQFASAKRPTNDVDRAIILARSQDDIVALYQSRKNKLLAAIALGLRRQDLDVATIDELATMLHKLAGTAGFFDEGALGEVASKLEHDLKCGSADDWPRILKAGWHELQKAA